MEPANDTPVPKTGVATKFLLKIAGVDERTLLQCPPHDWDNARAVGEIMVCTWLFQSGLFSLIGHRLFAVPGQIRPDLIAGAMFLATFILLIDSYMIMRSGWHLAGIEALKRGGLDISGGPTARIKAGFFTAVRIFLSIGLAQLTAIFSALLIFNTDIEARIQGVWQNANARSIAAVTRMVDDGIQRAADAESAQAKRVDALAGQVSAIRQNEIDPAAADPQVREAQQEVTQLIDRQSKADDAVRDAETFASNELAGIKKTDRNSGQAGNGPRHRAAVEQLAQARSHAREIAAALAAARTRLETLRKSHVADADAARKRSDGQLPGFETALHAEEARLASLRQTLATAKHDRDGDIRSALEKTPDYVRPDDGFLAQIVTLGHIADSDPKIATVILLIDLVSFGFELAAVLAKITSYVPTTYAALLARDAYMQVVRLTNEMAAEINDEPPPYDPAPEFIPPEAHANDNEPEAQKGGRTIFASGVFNGFDDPPPPPPRRPRGRPRKTELN